MKAFFNLIKDRIENRSYEGLPFLGQLKTVRMWNNQLPHSNGTGSPGRNEKAFPYPACFIEFIVEDVANLPLGIVDYSLIVRFRFAVKRYETRPLGQEIVKLNTLDFCDDFLKAVQLMAPDPDGNLTFTTLQLATPDFDEDSNNVDAPFVDFRTRLRSSAAYKRSSDVLREPISGTIKVNVPITFE